MHCRAGSLSNVPGQLRPSPEKWFNGLDLEPRTREPTHARTHTLVVLLAAGPLRPMLEWVGANFVTMAGPRRGQRNCPCYFGGERGALTYLGTP